MSAVSGVVQPIPAPRRIIKVKADRVHMTDDMRKTICGRTIGDLKDWSLVGRVYEEDGRRACMSCESAATGPKRIGRFLA